MRWSEGVRFLVVFLWVFLGVVLICFFLGWVGT